MNLTLSTQKSSVILDHKSGNFGYLIISKTVRVARKMEKIKSLACFWALSLNNFVMSVCPPVRMRNLDAHLKRIFIKSDILSIY